MNKLSIQFSFNKSLVILLACVFCWVLLCNTTLVYFNIWFVIFLHKKYICFLDFVLPVVYLLFNVYIFILLQFYTSALIGEACFV